MSAANDGSLGGCLSCLYDGLYRFNDHRPAFLIGLCTPLRQLTYKHTGHASG
jgi:hypothetical protein